MDLDMVHMVHPDFFRKYTGDRLSDWEHTGVRSKTDAESEEIGQ